MKSTTNILDLSPLPPSARRQLRDFYQFLLSRDQNAGKQPVDAARKHDRWFRDQVEAAVQEANNPTTEFILHEKISSEWTEKKKTLKAGANKGKLS